MKDCCFKAIERALEFSAIPSNEFLFKDKKSYTQKVWILCPGCKLSILLSMKIELDKKPEPAAAKCQHVLGFNRKVGGPSTYICRECGREFRQVPKGALLECQECGRKKEKSEMLCEEGYGKYGKWSRKRKYERCLECEKKRRDILHA